VRLKRTMPAKRKALKKGGSSKSSSKVDWATVPREQFVYLEVCARAPRRAFSPTPIAADRHARAA